jgi:YegS/Rv2252/BmrU family lipid kinase
MTAKRKIRIIANPFSGSKGGEKIEAVIDLYLDKSKFDHEICITQYSGHATELSSQAAALGFYAVIAAGGDGTINEVASSLVGTKTALGIIPLGSGNGFSYHLGIRRSKKKALEVINLCNPVLIDTVTANEHFFLNVAGLGLDATVAYNTRKNKKRGFLPYFINAVRESIRFKALDLEITSNGKTWRAEYTAAVIANASIYGYNFSIAPEADISDGLFDVILLKKASLLSYFLTVPRMLTRSIHKSKIIDYFKASELTVRHKGQSFFHKDGEGLVVEGNIHFKIRPASLLVLMP